MRIQVSGKQIGIGDALRSHVEDRLHDAVGKYFDRPVEAVVTFSRDRHEFCSDASVHLPTGLTVQAKSRADDIYAAFEGAVDRMDKQLRRYKRRLKDHHRNRENPIDSIGAQSYILAGQDHDEADEPDTLQPVIVAEMETSVPHLSVGEAVMHMELAGAQLLVFRNEKHGGVNVVYMRDDGNIGWIDPRNGR
ncbi:MAG TPA: ribosome-associated translation inhibitor RaiA [Amaricoccus sp.]|uniref:ribosome hibernation-promoting factor, HPF/YfiA family n=1 Tax=Amaricoccus sp. TaxID=1872485 RepID=UPI002CB1756E|nr:ribosome-associated translation inhibitor RaiA [Amaricoccus sp.]HMQ91504.1 ribosome-associated translation inhibitor RaiA [Amaricoccus sp.]HMR50923.1 ribosome-associated translation inhibitor RaiA [Amaricoccus sp.]HMR58906.1 ribosome-associated translation inhibitor RaiA [Amaricoccus sp.]HMT97898.1 ribosome-associated translation inhibitor RaiA [Amaricoccus sp.]